ncbi:MAG: Tol-Pal system beta propeller repeat protein TolB [Elusimicrobiota bacterium]
MIPKNYFCFKKIIIIAAFFIFIPREVWLADVFINLEKSKGEKLVLLVDKFLSSAPEDEKLSAALNIVLRRDFVFSDVFSLASPPYTSSPDIAFSPQDKELARWAVDLLLKGKVSSTKDSFSLEVYVYDITTGQVMFKKVLAGKTGGERRLIHLLSDEIVLRFTGKPGIAHSRITFINDSSGYKELYLVDYDGYNLRRLTRHRSIVLLPTWSVDAENIYFTTFFDGNPDLYLYSLASGKIKPFSVRHGLNMSAAVSPDGKLVALTRTEKGDPEIFLLDSAGKTVRRLTFSKGADTSPSFSSTGREIVFVADREGSPHLYIVDVEGVNLRQITFSGYQNSPSWSPLGDRIAFTQRNKSGRFDIFTIYPDGSNLTKLTYEDGSNEDPCWSPDGRFILFTSTRNGQTELFFMRPDGTDQERLLVISGKSSNPDWSR